MIRVAKRDVTCIASLQTAEWFYRKIDPTDHLISCLMYHSSQRADSLSVWESDFKVPSTTEEMAL